jgi:signal transduction histidine kinase
VLGLLDHDGDAPSLRDRVEGFDGWTHFACPPNFLVARLGQILNGQAPDRPARPAPIPIDVRLLAMIVHDLRNPLNVIGLTLRVIEQMPSANRSEIQEDLGFLKDNAGQIEKILGLLSDLCRLGDLGPPGPVEFDPRRLVEEILEEKAHRWNDKSYPATFVSEPMAPGSVVLDPMHARLAILSALTNAAAVTDRPLALRSSGGGGRWTLAINVDRPPPATVRPEEARAERFERLIGSTSERKGLDLALAAWIADQSGGKVRLEVDPGRRSTIVLDWPVRPT